jgi:hypothetical protein
MADTLKPTALVVEDDGLQRLAAVLLLQETGMDVIHVKAARRLSSFSTAKGGCLCLMFTDVNLSGTMTVAELAILAADRFPRLRVIGGPGTARPSCRGFVPGQALDPLAIARRGTCLQPLKFSSSKFKFIEIVSRLVFDLHLPLVARLERAIQILQKLTTRRRRFGPGRIFIGSSKPSFFISVFRLSTIRK